jgi:hypothetical protein
MYPAVADPAAARRTVHAYGRADATRSFADRFSRGPFAKLPRYGECAALDATWRFVAVSCHRFMSSSNRILRPNDRRETRLLFFARGRAPW